MATATVDNQTSIEFPIYEGERIWSESNRKIGTIVMSDLVPLPADQARFRVEIYVGSANEVFVMVEEIASNREERLRITSTAKDRNYSDLNHRQKLAEMTCKEDLAEIRERGIVAPLRGRSAAGFQIDCTYKYWRGGTICDEQR
jgi:heat shock protein 1/8